VGCGVHAGSATEVVATVRRCRELGVEVGAHPGYDDRPNFGRLEIELSVDELADLVRFQVGALAAVAPIAYIKAHGALYHYCQSRPPMADALALVAREFETGLMGQPGFEIVAAAERAGVPAFREGFADRAYLPDGNLMPRSQSGAVLPPEQAAFFHLGPSQQVVEGVVFLSAMGNVSAFVCDDRVLLVRCWRWGFGRRTSSWPRRPARRSNWPRPSSATARPSSPSTSSTSHRVERPS